MTQSRYAEIKHLTFNIRSECFNPLKHKYATLKFVYDITSRLNSKHGLVNGAINTLNVPAKNH